MRAGRCPERHGPFQFCHLVLARQWDARSAEEVSALKEEHARRMSELQRKHAEEQVGGRLKSFLAQVGGGARGPTSCKMHII